MKLQSLAIEQYRGFTKAVVMQFHDRLTQLIGENGAGKEPRRLRAWKRLTKTFADASYDNQQFPKDEVKK